MTSVSLTMSMGCCRQAPRVGLRVALPPADCRLCEANASSRDANLSWSSLKAWYSQQSFVPSCPHYCASASLCASQRRAEIEDAKKALKGVEWPQLVNPPPHSSTQGAVDTAQLKTVVKKWWFTTVHVCVIWQPSMPRQTRGSFT